MQVHGDMSVGIGYGLSEQMLLDEKTGRVLNGSLLDYKLPTMMYSPDLCLDSEPLSWNELAVAPIWLRTKFTKLIRRETKHPAQAIRNAFLHATGIPVNEVPLSPQRVFEALKKSDYI